MGWPRGPQAPVLPHGDPGGRGEAAPWPRTSPRRCLGLASLRDTLSFAAALVTSISRQSGNGTAAQGGGGAEPRLSILLEAAGSWPPPGLTPLSILLEPQTVGSPLEAAPLPERGEGPGHSTRVWGQSPARWHIPTPQGPSTSEARYSLKLGRGTRGLLSGRPICPRLHPVALVTPGGPCPGPPGPGIVPQGTCQGLREGEPGPCWPWVPALCLPGETPLWAPAPSLCPQQWAPGAASPSSPKKRRRWAEPSGNRGGRVAAAAVRGRAWRSRQHQPGPEKRL